MPGSPFCAQSVQLCAIVTDAFNSLGVQKGWINFVEHIKANPSRSPSRVSPSETPTIVVTCSWRNYPVHRIDLKFARRLPAPKLHGSLVSALYGVATFTSLFRASRRNQVMPAADFRHRLVLTRVIKGYGYRAWSSLLTFGNPPTAISVHYDRFHAAMLSVYAGSNDRSINLL